MDAKGDEMSQALVGPMSEEELQFLQDIKGVIDHATRNGLSFLWVLAILSHDVNEILRHGMSLAGAKATGFLPKAERWRLATADAVGEPDEVQ